MMQQGQNESARIKVEGIIRDQHVLEVCASASVPMFVNVPIARLSCPQSCWLVCSPTSTPLLTHCFSFFPSTKQTFCNLIPILNGSMTVISWYQAYNILELYLEQFNSRSALISQTKEIPRDLIEAIASTVFAAKVGRSSFCILKIILRTFQCTGELPARIWARCARESHS